MATLKVHNMSKSSFFWYRLIPGGIAVLILTAPVWTSLLGVYDLLLLYLAFIGMYLVYRSAQTVVTNIIGHKWMQRDMSRDWAGDLKKLDFKKLPHTENLPGELSQLYHIIFIPIYKDPLDLLDETFKKIAEQDYPFMKKVIIVAAVEERAGPEQKKVIQKIKSRYESKVGAIWDFYHPFGIPDEVVGDACANLRWAGIKASEKFAKEGHSSKDTIFTKFDSDTRLHNKFLSALTHTYLTTERRLNSFYGPAIPLYSNNYWRVPAIVRVFSGSMTTGILNEWIAERSKKQSFSIYSSNFQLLEKGDFWDATTGAEDTYFYWNTFLHLDGDFIGVPFFLPVTMDCIEGSDFKSSITSLYKQQLRWGWGVLIMPMAVQGMVWNKKISLPRKLGKFGVLFRSYNFFLTTSLLLAISMPILILLNNNVGFSSISYNLPRIISVLLTSALIFQIPSKIYLWKFYGSPPKEKPWWFSIWWWILEPFLMFINIWTYYLLPRFQAMYELTVGKTRKKFHVAIEGRVGES